MKLTLFILTAALTVALAAAARAEDKRVGISWVFLPAQAQAAISSNTCSGCSLGKIQRRTVDGAVTYVAEIRKPGGATATVEVTANGEPVANLAAIAPAAGSPEVQDTGAPEPVASKPQPAQLTAEDYNYLETLGVAKDSPRLKVATPAQLRILHFLINDKTSGDKAKQDSVKAAIGQL